MILPTTGGAYNSGGVNTDVRYSISQQGTFAYTTSATDLAINGQGFFIVTGADGVEYLTRAGDFTVMDDGTMVNSYGDRSCIWFLAVTRSFVNRPAGKKRLHAAAALR